jgi:hypothetical protein
MSGNSSNNTKNRHRSSISIDSTILLFGLLNVCLDQSAIEHGLKLALRGPDFIRDGIKALFATQGISVAALVQNEWDIPASQLEVRQFVEVFLKKGAEMSTLAQITDVYLFEKDSTPENVVYAFYIATRYVLVRERKPTKPESKRIWEIALWIAQNSKIGAPHWKKLEARGQVHLDDWLVTMKENARKRFETFLKHKKRAELASKESLDSLLEAVFDMSEPQS